MTSLELFDETLDINSTENYELAVQCGTDGFAFCLLDTLRNKFVLIRAYEPEENKYFNSENIKEFILKDDFLSRTYRKIRIVVPSSRFTLVPAPMFDPAKKDDYFTFNLGNDSSLNILANRTSEPDMYVVSGVPRSVHEVLRNFYPVVHPCVHIVPLFDNISKNRKNIHGNYVHLHIERDYFNMIIFKENQLRFCNTFRHRNVSDVLYYVLNIFRKLELKQEEALHLSGLAEKGDVIGTGLSEYIPDIRFAAPRGNFSFSYVFDEILLHRFINLFSVFNCG